MQSLLEVLAGTLLEEEDMRLDAGRGGGAAAGWRDLQSHRAGHQGVEVRILLLLADSHLSRPLQQPGRSSYKA